MMNCVKNAAFLIPKTSCFLPHAALFHSTPVLERKRRSFTFSNLRYNSKRFRRMRVESLLRSINPYADYILQADLDENDPSSSKGPSWFKKHYSRGSKSDWTNRRGNRHGGRKGFEFSEYDFEVERFFQSVFGGNQYFHWSFINEENPRLRSSFQFTNNYGRSRGFWSEQEYESSSECDSLKPDLTSDRLALGLSASGPLKLEEVKTAYRACALKWHPDRHQGTSKAVAEEKFKLCSAAYHSLCGKLTEA